MGLHEQTILTYPFPARRAHGDLLVIYPHFSDPWSPDLVFFVKRAQKPSTLTASLSPAPSPWTLAHIHTKKLWTFRPVNLTFVSFLHRPRWRTWQWRKRSPLPDTPDRRAGRSWDGSLLGSQVLLHLFSVCGQIPAEAQLPGCPPQPATEQDDRKGHSAWESRSETGWFRSPRSRKTWPCVPSGGKCARNDHPRPLCSQTPGRSHCGRARRIFLRKWQARPRAGWRGGLCFIPKYLKPPKSLHGISFSVLTAVYFNESLLRKKSLVIQKAREHILLEISL